MILRPLKIVACAATVCLAACATTQQVDPAIATALSTHGVTGDTYDKVCHAEVLGYQDILNLVKQKVPTNIIMSYLGSTRKVYNFSYAQLQGLRQAGASAQLLNYLTESQGFYGNNTPKQKKRTALEQKGEYFNSPHYQDRAPFAYDAPIIDDWYDSAYDESLYSPFSFN